jgi:Zn-dependent protease
MILGRLRGRQDKGSLTGALVKGGFVVVKASKLLLALASFAAYTFLFTWQFAVIILGMLVIHEYGHLRCMKHYGMRTRGIYLIPFFGAAAVAGDDFPSRRAEATIALAGPLTGAVLAGGTGLLYFATRNGAFAAAAAWMALVNLFNLLPVVPLDGGRVVKSIALSVGSRTGLVTVIAGMLLGAVLALAADLWIFVILIPLGLLDYLLDSYNANRAAWRPKRGLGRHVRIAEAQDDAEAAKPPLSRRAAQAAFACYAGLAILLWLLILAMGHQPGAAAAMHALQG